VSAEILAAADPSLTGLADAPRAPGLPRRLGPRLLVTPALLTLALTALYLWVSSQPLDSIEHGMLNRSYLLARIGEQVRLSCAASALVVLIAVPAGILATRQAARRIAPLILAVANIGQAVPAIGLLVLLTMVMDVGFRTALIGLLASSLLPVLRNTITGLNEVDRTVMETARAMGMRPGQILRRIELPLAVPVILAGVRTALVFCVGTATLAALIDSGGLGGMISSGLSLQRTPIIVTGSVLAASIAFFLDWLGSVAEDLLRPRGL